MPRKSKEPTAAEAVGSVPIPVALLDELVQGPMSPTDVQAVFQSFKQAVIERAMASVDTSNPATDRHRKTGHHAGELRLVSGMR